FAVIDAPAAKNGVTLRIKMVDPIEPGTKTAMGNLLHAWANHIGLYLDPNGLPGRMVISPKMSNNKTTFTMFYNLFTYEPKPAREMLVNLLVYFHEKVSPVAQAEFEFMEPKS